MTGNYPPGVTGCEWQIIGADEELRIDLTAAMADALRAVPAPATCKEWQTRVDASYEGDAAVILPSLLADPRTAVALAYAIGVVGPVDKDDTDEVDLAYAQDILAALREAVDG